MMRKVILNTILLINSLCLITYGNTTDSNILILNESGNVKKRFSKDIIGFAIGKGGCLRLFIYPNLLISADGESIFYVTPLTNKIKLTQGRFLIEVDKDQEIKIDTSEKELLLPKGKYIIEVNNKEVRKYNEDNLPQHLLYMLRTTWCYNDKTKIMDTQLKLPLDKLKVSKIKRRKSIYGSQLEGASLNVTVQSSCVDTMSGTPLSDPSASGGSFVDPSVKHKK